MMDVQITLLSTRKLRNILLRKSTVEKSMAQIKIFLIQRANVLVKKKRTFLCTKAKRGNNEGGNTGIIAEWQ